MVDTPRDSHHGPTTPQANEEPVSSSGTIQISLGTNFPSNIQKSLAAASQPRAESRRSNYRDWNRVFAHTPDSSSLSPSVCDVCQTIPFDILPTENDAALPHHTWQELQSSAASCSLCRVVLWAVEKLRAVIITEVGHGQGSQYLWGGRFISGPVPDIEPFCRVYLFASKWYRAKDFPQRVLMGLGTRLGPDMGGLGLGPREADGQRLKMSSIRGTTVRICTDFGMISMTLTNPWAHPDYSVIRRRPNKHTGAWPPSTSRHGFL